MKHTLASLVIGLSLLMGTATGAWAQDFQKGVRAYQSGDYGTALREFRLLAESGDANAQLNLGVMYDNGEGVVQDYKEAVKWYRLSAEQGYVSAQFNLGAMLANGVGIIQDNVMAHMWFNIGASNGDSDAAKYRDAVAKLMTAADISKAQQLARECVAKNYKGC